MGRPPHCPAASDTPTTVKLFHVVCLCFEQPHKTEFVFPRLSPSMSPDRVPCCLHCVEILHKARRMCLAEVRLKVKVAMREKCLNNSQVLRCFPSVGPFFQKQSGLKCPLPSPRCQLLPVETASQRLLPTYCTHFIFPFLQTSS